MNKDSKGPARDFGSKYETKRNSRKGEKIEHNYAVKIETTTGREMNTSVWKNSSTAHTLTRLDASV